MNSKVYFVSSRVKNYKGLLKKFELLMQKLDLPKIEQDESVLIKTHLGEDGNTAFINPMYIRKCVDYIKGQKAHPFVGDTNTLYTGRRKRSVTHLELAYEHGFSYSVINAPVVMLEGLAGSNKQEIPAKLKHFDSVQLAGEFVDCDATFVISHVKGHLAAGMGAAIKNLSMGLGTRTQKQRMHGDIKPQFHQKKCINCGNCIAVCPEDAISRKSPAKMEVDFAKCVGCAECITHCPTNAFQILWNSSSHDLAEKMSETAFVAHSLKKGKIYYFNFLINITPDCDCMGWSDNPVVNDIGLLASEDPIAIDKASFDLINQQTKLHNCVIEKKEGEVFSAIHPKIDPIQQLKYGAEIGLGNLDYELIDMDDKI